MKKQKNKFFTFLFSLLPGAGEMYMGFMKMGVSLMGIFFLTCAVSIFLQIEVLMFIAAVVWFYSFFHAHNLAGMPIDKFEQLEDIYLIPEMNEEMTDKIKSVKFKNWISVVLIVVGFVLLWQSFSPMIQNIAPIKVQILISNLSFYGPKMVAGIVVIVLGISMIRGKKKQLEEENYGNRNDSASTE